ncbi:MAG TPA: glycosyl transferase family 1 [Morganella sp. (in: Bacteria)]|nr:glycosyl transferase family 1 [Morganella sp. (in: enterobacteria)]
MKKKIIFNCTTNTAGGAVQNAVNFIREIYNTYIDSFDWYFLLSKPVSEQLKDIIINIPHYISEKTPAHSYFQRKKLNNIIKRINPDLVYTSAGPAYMKIKSFHLMGCSNPYILGVDNSIKKTLFRTFSSRLKRNALTIYQRHHIKNSDAYIVQTEHSKNQLLSVTKNNNVYIIYNSLAKRFYDYSRLQQHNIEYKSYVNSLKLLIPSAYYQHKNIEIAPLLIKKIKDKYNIDLYITLTINDIQFKNHIENLPSFNLVRNNIINNGPYQHKDALSLYLDHDVILQPSLVEVFSTSYIETIAVKKPLIAPNLPFVKSIVNNYPLYFHYSSLDECVDSIYSASLSLSKKRELSNYEEYINMYGAQSQRVNKIITLINSILN